MSSGFVPAGSGPAAENKNDAWAKARETVEATKKQKSTKSGEQEGGKSLFEHLQAQKAAKQEAFEDAAKLRNQFRALDDSEVDFLQAVREKERAKEAATREEDSKGLEEFRREQAVAEQAARERALKDENVENQRRQSNEWATARKRRKVDNNKIPPQAKAMKITEAGPDRQEIVGDTTSSKTIESKTNTPHPAVDDEAKAKPAYDPLTTTIASSNLGLVVYNSDSDE